MEGRKERKKKGRKVGRKEDREEKITPNVRFVVCKDSSEEKIRSPDGRNNVREGMSK